MTADRAASFHPVGQAAWGDDGGAGDVQQELRQQCQEAIEAVEQALALKPPEVGEQVDVAERATARLRDTLIAELRRGRPVRSFLSQTNVALSLIVGVEYPVGGYHRTVLEQARDTLRDILQSLLHDASV